ncbi:Gag-like protein, partial [Operophtera brumata]
MDISKLDVNSVRSLLQALITSYPNVVQELLSAPASVPASQALNYAPFEAPQASLASNIPDSPESPDPAPAVDDQEMEFNQSLHLSPPAESSSDDDYIVITGGKRKKASVKNAPPAKTVIAPATTRPTPPPASSSPPATTSKEKPPPPLFLREKEKWDNVSSLLRERNIHYTSARSTKDGIKVQLQTSADHRKMTALLRSESVGFHTYALEDERLLRVVIRGLPAEHNT